MWKYVTRIHSIYTYFVNPVLITISLDHTSFSYKLKKGKQESICRKKALKFKLKSMPFIKIYKIFPVLNAYLCKLHYK